MPDPVSNTPASDDVSSTYLDQRQLYAQTSAAEELLSRVGAGADEQSERGIADLIRGVKPPQEGSRMGSVAKDVGMGIVETPRAVATGIHDAIAESYNLVDDVAGWVDSKLPDFMRGGVDFSLDGVKTLNAEEMAKARAEGKDVASQVRGVVNDATIDDPKSSTGKMVKGVTQFLTGFVGVKKLFPLPAATTKLGVAGQAAAQGAAADFTVFDPHQQRLADLVEQFPALSNPVTDYLASDPGDSNAEGRFKNALEGLGLGQLVNGMVRGVRLLRQVAKSKVTKEVEAAPPKLADDAFSLLGDDAAEVGSDLVTVRKPDKMAVALETTEGVKPKAVADAAAGAGKEKPELFINFAKIDSPEDVQRAMQEMGDRFKKSIDAERRGKQTFEQITLNAEQENAWKALSERRQGEPLNAEQSVAARQLWASSADKLTELARLAAANPSEGNLFAFRKMLATHQAVQQEVIAARTETARALASWRIPVGGSAERLREVAFALEDGGGPQLAREMAERVARLAASGQHAELAEFVSKGAYAKTRDAMLEAWTNGLLSAPPTHMVNAMSNTSVLFQRMAERGIAAKLANALGDEGSVAAGEATAQWFGLVSGIKDAFRYAMKNAQTGESGFGLGKMEGARERSISAEAFGLSSSGWLGRGADLLGAAVNVPGRAMGVSDEFFKTLGYRMELNAQALRMATDEANAGKIPPEGLKGRIAEILEKPPENVRMASVDAANYQTFTGTPGKIAELFGKAKAQFPLLRMFLPFTRTPANIMRYTFERTPLAPLMQTFRANVAAGGARRDLALAQMGLGTTIMLATADAAMNGKISGSGPKGSAERQALERTGWKAYSLQIGDRWFAYNRLDPLGSNLGLAADLVDALRNAQDDSIDDVDAESLTVATTMAILSNVTNKTYLSGLSDVFEAMASPQGAAEKKLQRLAGSAVPAVVASVARQQDPYAREVNSMLDALKARTPGLSDSLPPRRNVWGEAISHESGLGGAYDFLSPIYTKSGKGEAIDKEILRIGAQVTMPPRRTNFDGVTVDLAKHPGAYSRYVELAGNSLKHPAWGLGAKDLLNEIVGGKHPLSQVYQLRSDGPEGGKDTFIRDTLRQYRELARKQLLEEYPQIKEDVGERQNQQRALRMPTIG